ncbi:MAG: lipase class 3 family [Trebouxia sp. A1-2]|nr:MAG: lipase class 3 family [Trebouxia sp. A1-2]
MERQQKAQTVWHGVALQDGSVACQSLAATEAVEAAVAAFKVHSSDLLQDVFNCLVLAETVYKVQEGNHLEVASTVSALRQDFPAPLISLQRLQWSLPHVPHRYLLAEDNDALYVSFIGTKQRRDIMTNANIMQENLWPDLPIAADSQEVPAAHTGFLNRARGVPIQELYQLAKKLNKRLVLTGHSLGGAIALLCTLDLLHSLVDEPNLKLTCVGFATPAVGNAALAEYVKNKGWQKYITNYLVPEDVVTRLLPPRPATTAQSADQSADQAAGPAHPALWASLADNFSSSSEAGAALVSPPSSPSSCSSFSSEGGPLFPPTLSQEAGLQKKSHGSLVLPTAAAAVSPQLGIWNRTAQLARLVSFPVRATRAYYSYVPLGQQLYLNPQTVATSLHPDAPAADPSSHPNLPPLPADEGVLSPGASAHSVPDNRLDEGIGQPDDSPLEKAAAVVEVMDSVVQQRREQLGRLWMHRMPTYRARFHQIFYAALSLPLPHLAPAVDGASEDNVLVLSRPIAPEVHIVKADTSASLLSPHHLKDLLQDGVNAVAEQPGFRWFWIWSGAWPAIRHSLRRRQQDTTMQITIHGHGLEHATSSQVTFGTEVLTSRVMQQPQPVSPDMSWPSLDGFSILQAAFAMLLVSKPAKEMILEVVMPARLMHRAHSQLVSTGSPGLQVVVQSDFCSTSIPVSVHNDAQALQDSFAGMLAVCRLVSALLKKTKSNDVAAEC